MKLAVGIDFFLASRIGLMYEGNLVFSLKHNQFFMYEREGQGLWSPMSKVEMAGDIRSKLLQVRDEGEIIEGFNTKCFDSAQHDILKN